MQQKTMFVGIGGLLLGSLITFLLVSKPGMSQQPESRSESTQHGGMSMSEMNSSLEGKKGDDFDKAFILHMIDHHQGAIEMAQKAESSAKHEEIKKLSDEIISAQQKEIEQMKAWQKAWGYTE